MNRDNCNQTPSDETKPKLSRPTAYALAGFVLLHFFCVFFFFDAIFELMNIGEFKIFFLFFAFGSLALLGIGTFLLFRASPKAIYIYIGSAILGICSLYYWRSAISIACIAPILGACWLGSCLSVARRNLLIFGATVTLLVVVGSLYSFVAVQQDAMKHVKNGYIDPDSARFRNLRTIPTLGNAVCGEVNAKNRMGAYSGFQNFIYLNSNGNFRVINFDPESTNVTGKIKMNLSKRCFKAIYKEAGWTLPKGLEE